MKSYKNCVVLIRTACAGVHVGELVEQDGDVVDLANAHRIWRWRGANTLHELSQRGAAQECTRISEPVPAIRLLGVVEILPCAEIAALNLRSPRWGA